MDKKEQRAANIKESIQNYGNPKDKDVRAEAVKQGAQQTNAQQGKRWVCFIMHQEIVGGWNLAKHEVQLCIFE